MEDPILTAIDSAQLRVSRTDPNAHYENLVEIGHGNFGKVFSAVRRLDTCSQKNLIFKPIAQSQTSNINLNLSNSSTQTQNSNNNLNASNNSAHDINISSSNISAHDINNNSFDVNAQSHNNNLYNSSTHDNKLNLYNSSAHEHNFNKDSNTAHDHKLHIDNINAQNQNINIDNNNAHNQNLNLTSDIDLITAQTQTININSESDLNTNAHTHNININSDINLNNAHTQTSHNILNDSSNAHTHNININSDINLNSAHTQTKNLNINIINAHDQTSQNILTSNNTSAHTQTSHNILANSNNSNAHAQTRLIHSELDLNNTAHTQTHISNLNTNNTYAQTHETVAIKQIELTSHKDKDKILEIRRELEILRNICHPNCIELIDIFFCSPCVWIVMEFCIGSTKDLLNILGTLNESQIAYIAKYTLRALEYIHSLGYIHRDIKAENILFSQHGQIKLADFGSASLKEKTNTFVGTPFWMAPEVILAMDDGIYSCKCDIWSMGITSYEFGEKQPPLFHLNTMSALYHISQNDPPQLVGDKWSVEYKDFTNMMLQKEENDRPNASQMLEHSFIKNLSEDFVFSELLQRCSAKAREENETAVNTYIKYLSDISTGESSEVVGENAGENTETEIDVDKSRISGISNASDDSGNVSKINSAKTLRIDNSKAPISDEKISQISMTRKDSSSKVQDKNIGTIKTYEAIKDETDRRQDVGHLQVKDYQILRKTNQKKLMALEQKLANEIASIKKNHIKSLELVKLMNSKAIKVLQDRYDADLEKFKRNFKNDLKNVLKNKIDNAIERRNIINSLSNIESLIFNRSQFFTTLSTNSSPADVMSNSEISPLPPTPDEKSTPSENNFVEVEKLVNDSINKIKEIYRNLYVDKNKLMVSHRQNIGRIEINDNNIIVQKELCKLEKIFQKKEQLLKKLHDYETQTQNEYVKQKVSNLKKSHMIDRKNRPNEFKNIEAMFSKKYKIEVKNITEIYKNKLKNLSDKAPRENLAKLRNKLELEKINLILAKKKEMEHQINIYQEENSKQDNYQSKELNDLEMQLQQESTSLANYQMSQLNHLAKTKMNELQCIHKRFEELEENIKKSINNDIKLLNDTHSVELVELMKPLDFSFDHFIFKNKSLSQDIGNITSNLLAKIDNPYASLNLSKSRRKFLPEF